MIETHIKNTDEKYNNMITEVRVKMDMYGISQKELASAMHIDESRVSSIINQKQVPSVKRFMMMVNILAQLEQKKEAEKRMKYDSSGK